MRNEHAEKRRFWDLLDKVIDLFDDIFSDRQYSDYEIYGDDYHRD